MAKPEDKQKVFNFLDKYGDQREELKKRFPGIIGGTLRGYVKKWKDAQKIQPDNKTKTANPEKKKEETDQRQLELTNQPEQVNQCNPEQINQRSPEPVNQPEPTAKPEISFLSELEAEKDVLMEIIKEYKANKAIKLNSALVEVQKPFTAVNYSIMESLHEEFKEVAKEKRISQRQAIHQAINLWIKQNKNK